MKELDSLLAVLIAAGVVLALSVYSVFSGGYVASCIWEWYAVPHGLPDVTWREFAAGSLLIAAIRRKEVQHDNRTSDEKKLGMVALMVAPWFVLLLAWVIR